MTADQINALPDDVRKYIHDLETNWDPAGMVAELALLKDQVLQLETALNEYRPREQKRCPSCHGTGEWETECCDGSRGCSCRGERVPMGTCHVCGGQGFIDPDNYDPRANIKTIRGMAYTGSGPRR